MTNRRDLVADVQLFGLFSAAAVVERYAGMVDRATSNDRLDVLPSMPDEPPPPLELGRAARLTDAYLRFLATTTELVESRTERKPGAPVIERALFPAVRPAGSSATSVWVHNLTTQSSGGLHVEVTDLASLGGVVIPAATVSVSPAKIDRIGPSTSREVRLRVDVGEGQPSGHYHGLVLISTAPDEPVALQLEVLNREEARR